MTSAQLTSRHVEIIQRLAQGQTDKEIAAALGIVPHTVKVHIKEITKRTGVSRRICIALWAVANGLVENPFGKERAA